MKFRKVRKAALKKWLHETKRVRKKQTDNFNQSFECGWQTAYGTKEDNDAVHYSIFCSIGEWNTNMTDFLTDKRFDNLSFSNEKDKDILYRHYTRILLCASEILTDFQDLLSTFRIGSMLTGGQLSNQKNASRNLMNTNLPANSIQNLFSYINNISKHKVNNVHVCNHHLHIHYAEIGQCDSGNAIKISEINEYISHEAGVAPNKIADTIVIPKLNAIIKKIINCYNVVDNEFRSDNEKYRTLCGLYEGVSVRE